MECESGRQGLEHHRIRPIHYIVSIALLFSGLVNVESPSLTWSAVYECLDVRGNPLLTNRPSHLHNCQMLIEETSDQTPSEVSPPKVSPKPDISDRLSLPSYVPPTPLPLNLPMEPSLPPPVRSDYSGAQSQPEAAPTQSLPPGFFER
jgi:hypothetical protein